MRVEHGGYDTVSKAQLRTRHWGSYNTHTQHHQGHGQGEQHAGEPGGGDRGEREEKVVNRQRQVTLREVKPS